MYSIWKKGSLHKNDEIVKDLQVPIKTPVSADGEA